MVFCQSCQSLGNVGTQVGIDSLEDKIDVLPFTAIGSQVSFQAAPAGSFVPASS